jgi:hypothetical protein
VKASFVEPGHWIFATFNGDMALVVDFLVDRGQLGYTEDGSLEDLANLDPAYAARMLGEPKRFLEAVRAWADQIPGLDADAQPAIPRPFFVAALCDPARVGSP